MIDDGTTEKCVLKRLGFWFLICKFPIVQAWQKHLHQIITSEDRMTIYAQLYIMYSCKTIAHYKAEYTCFLTLCKSQPFIEYFNRTWHNNKFYLHWTCIY